MNVPPGIGRRGWGVVAVVGLVLGLAAGPGGPARAQYPPGYPFMRVPPPVRTRGLYRGQMSFGERGYRMNIGEAFGNPYGGLGTMGYGFGYGVGPQFAPGGSVIYSSAYTTPGAPPMSGYYPPFAVYGSTFQNPALFPPGSPNRPTAPGRFPAPR